MAHQHPSPSAFAERDSEAGLVISKIGSSNNIERISGIKALPKLRILSLSRNQIKKLDGIEDAADTLEELWLSYNRIEKPHVVSKMTSAVFLPFTILAAFVPAAG